MKKALFSLVLLAVPMLSFAQHPISFGPKIGWNSTGLTTDYTSYLNDMKSGGQGGVFFSLYLNNFYIQPEVYLSIKRGSLDTTINDTIGSANPVSLSQTLTLTTIDVPLLLGYQLLDLKLVKLRIWGGPVASYILNKDFTLTLNGIDQSERISKEDFRDATWAVQIGAGLDVLMLTLDVGYEFGINEFMSVPTLDDFSLKNNLFFCSIGWRIY